MADILKPNGVAVNGSGPVVVKTNGIDLQNTHNEASSLGRGLGLIPALETPPMGELPPDIEHITEGYQPLAKLITRVVQETFKELVEVIDKMADMDPYQPSDNQVNGHRVVNAKVNVDKKMLFMNFIQKRRAQFIKLLVLTRWSYDSEEVSRLIDLKVWMDRQMALYDESVFWLLELKRSLEPAKLPNPDLNTAVKVLTTAKASWMPDLGYIAPKPLTPKDILKTLRNLNILLHIRLNLHENLPPHFKTFAIANGRATFTVPNEFEVDLSIAEEDPESQLFFIDFRLKFSPQPVDLPENHLRNQISENCNYQLKERGLAGLYQFLHEYTLMTKINLLRWQVLDLSRNLWTGSLKIEFLHRVLIVQYWTGRPGPKSWIEISAFNGDEKDSQGRFKSSGPSYLGLRWIKNGKRPINLPTMRLDDEKLSMESILKIIIGRHVKEIFTTIRTDLLKLPLYSRNLLELTVQLAHKEPVDSWFRLQLTASQILTIVLQPVTGVFSIRPSAPFTAIAEAELNSLKDPANESARRLIWNRSLIAQSEVDQRLSTLGWERRWVRLPPDVLKQVMPPMTLAYSLYKKAGWTHSWFLTVSFGPYGDQWKIVEIDGSGQIPTIRDHRPLILSPRSKKIAPNDYRFLSQLSQAGAGMCCLYSNCRALEAAGTRFQLHLKKTPVNRRVLRQGPSPLPVIVIGFASFFAPDTQRVPTWADPRLILRFEGHDPTDSTGIVSLETRLVNHQAYKTILDRPLDKNTRYDPSTGSLKIRHSAPIGSQCMAQLLSSLKRVNRLLAFLVTMTSFKLQVTSVSLRHITFAYTAAAHTASIGFGPPTNGAPSRLTLTLSHMNPHLLIHDCLMRDLNESTSFSYTLSVMMATLPVCRALAAIQARVGAAAPTTEEVFVFPRHSVYAHLHYQKAGAPILVFKIYAKVRTRERAELNWVVAPVEKLPEGRLRDELYSRWGGQGVPDKWVGLGDRVAAQIAGIEDVLGELDRVICEHWTGAPTVGTTTTTTTTTAVVGGTRPTV
ncbi:MAG: mediator complex subunit [Vezdaea aestivalis]|nr:MAG: mediator complex subunit [Vezdaea aestivalis]